MSAYPDTGAPRAFFFGCWKEAGHYLYERTQDIPDRPAGLRPVHDRATRTVLPFSDYGRLDGLFPPVDPAQRQGIARVAFFDGWTIVAFWDRSGPDKRMGCNSAFIIQGELANARLALSLAEALFPMVWARFPFTVKLKGSP